MLDFLKNHPFAVEAHFESSIVLTFAVPKEDIEHLLPPCLTLDTFNAQWAFVAVALVQTKSLRPKGFPKVLGNDFFLVGYRVFVRYTNQQGKRLRGLYILKSETDKKKMEYLGNLFTHYNYSTIDVSQNKEGPIYQIKSTISELSLSFEHHSTEVALPSTSPFSNWKEARRFAGPLPFTFSFNKKKQEVLIIEGVRNNWEPKPIQVVEYKVGFLKTLALKHAVLANAFIIEKIPYYWKKGKIEKWNS